MAFKMKGAPYCTCSMNTPIYNMDMEEGTLGVEKKNGSILVERKIMW